jgi:hypothetical protein
MKPDPYKKQASRRYAAAKAKARGGSTAATRGSAPSTRGRGSSARGRPANLGNNYDRFEDSNEEIDDATAQSLDEKALKKAIDDAFNEDNLPDAFFKLKDELDWSIPQGKQLKDIDEDFKGVDFNRLAEMVRQIPLPERLFPEDSEKGKANALEAQ